MILKKEKEKTFDSSCFQIVRKQFLLNLVWLWASLKSIPQFDNSLNKLDMRSSS